MDESHGTKFLHAFHTPISWITLGDISYEWKYRAVILWPVGDDVTDVSNEEQMLAFVQFFDVDQGKLECKFLFTANVLEDSRTADATTLHGVITK